jgi:hypothetical protein
VLAATDEVGEPAEQEYVGVVVEQQGLLGRDAIAILDLAHDAIERGSVASTGGRAREGSGPGRALRGGGRVHDLHSIGRDPEPSSVVKRLIDG